MNVSSTKWFTDQEMEEYSIVQQYHMNSIVGDVDEAQVTLPYSFSSFNTTNNGYKNDSSYDDLTEIKPSKIFKTSYISPKFPSPPPPSSSSSSLPNSKPHFHHYEPSSRILSFENGGPNVLDHESPKGNKRGQTLYRSQSNPQDHIIAERKRREKLTQRFVALSALVPGLKKMDKASVLGDALKHIKYLQERVNEFEAQKRERRLESMVLVKKSKLNLDDNTQSSSSSCCEDVSSRLDLPEIEVRFSDKDVLIKILCENQKGHITKIMSEIEKFRFSITNSIVLPFGPTLDITITAQKENDFDMTLMDVVKSLRSSLSKFMSFL